MDLEELHKRGERITVRWPGGLYDFVLEFHRAEPVRADWQDRQDWLMITGLVVEPEGVIHRCVRSFCVHPVEPEGEGEEPTYSLLPKIN